MKIAGMRVLGGEAHHVVVRIPAGPDRLGVQATPTLRGPWVLVAVKFGVITGTSPSVAVTVVPSTIPGGAFPSGRSMVGVPVIERAPAIAVAGQSVIGDPRMYPGRTYHWPWYVHDGDAGALAVWVWNEGAGNTVVEALLSVWFLARDGVGGGDGQGQGAGAGVGQYREVVGRLVGRPVG